MGRFISTMLGVGFSLVFAIQVQAQERDTWVQIEARPSLSEARESIRGYTQNLEDVAGFSLRSGWYAIALGPFTEQDADQLLRFYLSERLIPRDSYLVQTGDFERQYWPLGGNALSVDNTAPELDIEVLDSEDSAIPELEIDLETPAEARAGERLLSRETRAQLQEALKSAGLYEGTVDAAFGPGTRNAMSRWQSANGFERTGVLTSKQRGMLIDQYNAVLEELELELVRDTEAGIAIKIPKAVVAFEKYDAPFAHYAPTGDLDARILLISQSGDQDTMTGLFEAMQTLEIVPENGPRTLQTGQFTLIGESALTISHTQAWLEDGEIKGFTLIWPAGDEERRRRLLAEMNSSFTRLDGTLGPTARDRTEQRADVLSGLNIRKPKTVRTGFYVDHDGMVVTSADAVQVCGRITLDDSLQAHIAEQDRDIGLAVLTPAEPTAPVAVATFRLTPPNLQADLAVAGYSYGGVLDAPSLSYGKLAALQGLDNTQGINRLDVSVMESDIGGPVLDNTGAVLGALLPPLQEGRKLPEGVAFSADAEAVQSLIKSAGGIPSAASEVTQRSPEELSRLARNMTVLVSCWE